MKRLFFSATSLLLASLAVGLTPVFAKPPFKDIPTPRATSTVTVTLTPTPRPGNGIQSQIRLSTARLAACQAHERVIHTRMDNLTRYATNMLETFDKIFARIVEFYTKKVLPSGKSVENYVDLKDEVQKRQTFAQNAIQTAQTDANNFACDGVDPKGHLTLFRTDMREIKGLLKDYRTAIKDLIVAVHSVASESGTPTPTGL